MPSVQADWKAVGVDTELRQEDVQVAYQDFEIHAFQVGLGGWVSFDPVIYLDLLRSDTGGQNYGEYVNPRYDAELDAALATADPQVRAQHMRNAETMVLADAPIAPLYYASSRGLVSPKLAGWLDNPYDTHPVDQLCRAPSFAAPAGARAS
jgi:ABC-type transport system substrate-binding protein